MSGNRRALEGRPVSSPVIIVLPFLAGVSEIERGSCPLTCKTWESGEWLSRADTYGKGHIRK